MQKTIDIGGKLLNVTLRRTGAVQWCSDWAALAFAAASGDRQLRVWDCGPYGHREIFVLDEAPAEPHKVTPLFSGLRLTRHSGFVPRQR